MQDTRDIQPGDTVVRMGGDFAGVKQFQEYTVESFNPVTIDGLKLVGVRGSWNSQNFEVTAKAGTAPTT